MVGTLGTIYIFNVVIFDKIQRETRVMFSEWNASLSEFSVFKEEFGDDVYLENVEPEGHYYIQLKDPVTYESEIIGFFIPQHASVSAVTRALAREFQGNIELHSQESMLQARRMLNIELSMEITPLEMGDHPIIQCDCYEDYGDDYYNDTEPIVIASVNKDSKFFECKCGQDEIALISLN